MGTNTLPDEKLLQEVRAGNMLAFDELYRKYSQRIYKFAFSLLKVSEEAENIVQDVFLNLWLNRSKIEKDSSVRYYIFSIAYRSSVSVLRKKTKEIQYMDFLKSKPENDHDNAGLEAEFAELEERVNAIISELPARQQEVYRLHRQEGLKYQEIAERMGISVNTIENHMARALKTIRSKLGTLNLVALLFYSLFV